MTSTSQLSQPHLRPDLSALSRGAVVFPNSRALTIEQIDTVEHWDRLEDTWRELEEAHASPSPFLSWEWARTWWDTFGADGFELCILVCRRGTEIVGIAPLTRSKQAKWPLRPSRLRVIRLLGSGEADVDSVVTEYGDILVRPGSEAEVAEAMAHWLCSFQAPGWDAVVFEHTLEDSTVRRFLIPALRKRGRACVVKPMGVRYFLPLAQDWRTYLAQIGSSMRNRLTVGRRRMERAGGYEVLTVRDPQQMPEALHRLGVLHTRRWELKSNEGAFGSPRFVSFHETVASKLAQRGLAHITLVRVKGADVAGVYSLRSARGVFFYQTGFDPKLAENFSPGTVVLGLDIEHATNEGKAIYDFMGSSDSTYKTHYGCETASLDHAFVFNLTLFGQASRLLLKLQTYVQARKAARARAGAATTESSPETSSSP